MYSSRSQFFHFKPDLIAQATRNREVMAGDVSVRPQHALFYLQHQECWVHPGNQRSSRHNIRLTSNPKCNWEFRTQWVALFVFLSFNDRGTSNTFLPLGLAGGSCEQICYFVGTFLSNDNCFKRARHPVKGPIELRHETPFSNLIKFFDWFCKIIPRFCLLKMKTRFITKYWTTNHRR